jgi:hypothetical protein
VIGQRTHRGSITNDKSLAFCLPSAFGTALLAVIRKSNGADTFADFLAYCHDA